MAYRNIFPALTILIFIALASGCVTASLEEAAPKSLDDTATGGTVSADTTADAAKPVGSDAKSAANSGQGGGKPDKKARDNSFVAEGAVHDNEFPTFGPTPESAMEQLSPEEKQRILDEANAYLKRSKPKLDPTDGITGDISPDAKSGSD